MTITVNGQSNTSFTEPIYVYELLQHLNLASNPVLVEVNKVALLPREHATTQLTEGAIIEIIMVTAGG
ncbi:MAG: sulfur carrier protein ThiS [Verrucomicrobiaceae bacterium]|nr:sulfur carrier protein ThiS [Verrucomicrobiaceae bacterium]